MLFTEDSLEIELKEEEYNSLPAAFSKDSLFEEVKRGEEVSRQAPKKHQHRKGHLVLPAPRPLAAECFVVSSRGWELDQVLWAQ